MSEKINTFLIKNPYELIPMDRDDFYNEQVAEYKKNGEPSRAIEVVNIFIFNSHGELIIQKRSFDKKHNPGLLDKSIGGHMQYGDSVEYTVMVETIQELQTPSIVLKNLEDFKKAYKLLSVYLETVALVFPIQATLCSPVKIINGEEIKIANKVNLYVGVYDGRIRPVDREAKGVLFYSLDELKKEMEQTPNIFTDDLRLLMKENIKDFDEFVSLIKK